MKELSPEFAREPPTETRLEEQVVISQNPFSDILRGHANPHLRGFVDKYFRPLQERVEDIRGDVDEHFEPGTSGEQSTGKELEMYYQERKDPVIRLSETQVHAVDVLAEAADIPHQRGQTDIEIPEKLRHYSRWFRSQEYQALVSQVRSKKSRR